jgi:transcriptional regulator with XRE-family HTH domain
MEIDYRKIGTRIKTARELKKLTQEQLAEITGLTNNYISNIERSRSKPSIKTLIKLCNALDVTPDNILLDSVYVSKEHLADEIAIKLNKCSKENYHLVSDFISLLLERQEKKEQ